jgi:RNA polymerase-binding transcription factor DksA
MTADARALLDELRVRAAARAASASQALDELEHDPEGVPLSSEWSRLSALQDDAAARLRQVDDALVRLDAGAYGVCTACGRPIPPARLEVRPFAEHCVACAERLGR